MMPTKKDTGSRQIDSVIMRSCRRFGRDPAKSERLFLNVLELAKKYGVDHRWIEKTSWKNDNRYKLFMLD
jgi:hypothetical protein